MGCCPFCCEHQPGRNQENGEHLHFSSCSGAAQWPSGRTGGVGGGEGVLVWSFLLKCSPEKTEEAGAFFFSPENVG